MFGKKKERAEDQLQMVKLCNVASFVDAESKLARLKNDSNRSCVDVCDISDRVWFQAACRTQ